MTPIDDIELDLAAARKAANDLRSWIRVASATERTALLPELATGIAQTIALGEQRLVQAEAAESALELALAAQWDAVRAQAQLVAHLARAELPTECAELALLEMLGTHPPDELPADGLAPVDRTFVVAALAAREATREADDAFAAFVVAREALWANDGAMPIDVARAQTQREDARPVAATCAQPSLSSVGTTNAEEGAAEGGVQ